MAARIESCRVPCNLKGRRHVIYKLPLIKDMLHSGCGLQWCVHCCKDIILYTVVIISVYTVVNDIYVYIKVMILNPSPHGNYFSYPIY